MEDTKNKMVLSSQEELDEQMIQAAFQHLLDTYLATNHRRKVELITKAFNFAKRRTKACAAAPASRISCTPLPWRKSPAEK